MFTGTHNPTILSFIHTIYYTKVRNQPLLFYLTNSKNLRNIQNMETINIHSRHTPTIHQLRRAGWKVRVIHGKYDNNDELFDRFTRIELTSPDGKDSFGVANCSKKDQWNRKLGNRIALGRALKNYECIA